MQLIGLLAGNDGCALVAEVEGEDSDREASRSCRADQAGYMGQ